MDMFKGCPTSYTKTDKTLFTIIALIYGAVIGLTLVLFVEGFISLFVTAIAMTVIVAPVVEEIGKTSIVRLAKCTPDLAPRLIFWSALGFGLIEAFVHAIFLGTYTVSPTVLMHVVFSIPTAYAYKLNPKFYIFGLMVSIVLHGLWNFLVITLFGM